MERRLSAILVADMVGFSGLIEANELGTIAAQKRRRTTVIDPAMSHHNGRIVKTTGGGFLAEFPSVIEAVNCAVSIHRAMARDGDLAYRIGINLDDVVHEDGDIHGDGVNVAARLQHLADPGGICISGTVHDQMRNAVNVGYQDMGAVQVKNITRPIHAWRVLMDHGDEGKTVAMATPRRRSPYVLAAALAVCVTGAVWWWVQRPDFTPADPDQFALALPEQPSIAVQAFDNLSGDTANDFIGEGL